MDIAPFRQDHTVIQHRFQDRAFCLLPDAKSFTGPGIAKSGYGTDHSGPRFLYHLVFLTGINPNLVHLLLPVFRRLRRIFQRIFHLQDPGSDPQMGQSVALIVSGYFVNPCPK